MIELISILVFCVVLLTLIVFVLSLILPMSVEFATVLRSAILLLLDFVLFYVFTFSVACYAHYDVRNKMRYVIIPSCL